MFDFEENVWYVLVDRKGLAKEPFCEKLSKMIVSYGGKIKPLKVVEGNCYSFEYANGFQSSYDYIAKEMSVYFKRIFPTADCVAIDDVPPSNNDFEVAEIIQFPRKINNTQHLAIAC